ncbi:MAG: response regulator transcription factor [Planctomycetaceae bacterium]
MTPIRVLLVDDHSVLRAGVRSLLATQPDLLVVGEAGTLGDAERLALETRPDLLILDLSLPGGPSLPLLERLAAAGCRPKTLILTMYDDAAYVRAALAAGALGYVVKTAREEDLLRAIRDVCRGKLAIDLDDPRKTAAVFQAQPDLGRSGGGRNRLSQREEQVLAWLGRGYSNQAVAAELEISPKTVATYRARLADKLGLTTTADFVRFAIDLGLVSPQSNSAPPESAQH